jgi:hypothetical protein
MLKNFKLAKKTVAFKYFSDNIGVVGSGQMGTGIAYVFGR